MPTRTQPLPLESDPGAPETSRKLMKFDPTINTGTIIQICAVVVVGVFAVATFKADLATQQVQIETNRITAQRDNVAAVESLKELKLDVKDLQKSTNEIKESLAILRGRAADTASKR